MVFNIYNPDGSKAFSIESSTDCIESNELSLESLYESAESSYAECAKYIDAVEVLSTEGFGDAIKTGVSKAVGKIKDWLIKLKNWLMKLFKEIKYRITKFILSIKLRIQARKLKKEVVREMRNLYREVMNSSSSESYYSTENSDRNIDFEAFRSFFMENLNERTFSQVMYLEGIIDMSKSEVNNYVKALIDAKNEIYDIKNAKSVEEVADKMTQAQMKYGDIVNTSDLSLIEQFIKTLEDNKDRLEYTGFLEIEKLSEVAEKSDIVANLISSVTDNSTYDALQNTIHEYNAFIDNATMLAGGHGTKDERLLMQKVKALRELRPIVTEISRFFEFAQNCVTNYASILNLVQKFETVMGTLRQ